MRQSILSSPFSKRKAKNHNGTLLWSSSHPEKKPSIDLNVEIVPANEHTNQDVHPEINDSETPQETPNSKGKKRKHTCSICNQKFYRAEHLARHERARMLASF